MPNNRERGKRGERDARDAIRSVWGLRGSYRAAQSAGSLSADLGGTGDLHVEVKLRKSLAVYEFIEQAVRDAKDVKVPVVLMRRDRDEWLVMLRMSDTLRFIKALNEARNDYGLQDQDGNDDGPGSPG